MTARQDARVGTRSTGSETWSYETQRAPHVGEILQTARERKGVDLARAERDTKIRAKHLMALESGDFNDLPAPVYTKGFLRNYSTYLGLDADEVLSRWRREIDQPRTTEPVKVAPPPQPITAQGRGFKLTSGLIVALVLAAVVSGFLGYVGLQLIRFTQNPEVTLRGPSVRWLAPDATRIVIAGAANAHTRVTATGADDLVRTTNADASGSWSIDLPVATGRNDFSLFATDLETGRDSEPVQVIATVPVGEVSAPGARATPALPDGASGVSGTPSAQVNLIAPRKGTVAKKGKLKVQGTSDAESVLVSFQWTGKPGVDRTPPAPTELAVTDGVFRGDFVLPKGRWQVSVAAAADGGAPAVTSTTVKAAYDKTVLRITAVGGATRLKVLVDGGDEDDEILASLRLEQGKSRTFTSDQDLIVRAANAQAAQVTVDGVDYGRMGKKFEAKAWMIAKGKAPTPLR